MPATFDSRKQALISQLEAPRGEYVDASPKGSVDEGVRQLVRDINDLDGFVTTSSCAGRISVYQDGAGRINAEEHAADSAPVNSSAAAAAAAGGKGGGKWLFVSHDSIDLSTCAQDGALSTLLGLPFEQESWPDVDEVVKGFVHLKFEPLILHILTSSLAKAQHALSAAMTAGFRESGISSILSSDGGSDATPMVAVRTAGLAFDSIVAYVEVNGDIKPMVAEAYLRTLVAVANKRFVVNEQRKERFWQALRSVALDADGHNSGAANGHASAGWEPTDVRKARKRAEGLERQRKLKNAPNQTPEPAVRAQSRDESILEEPSFVEGLNDIPLRRSSFVSENARALFDDKDFIYLPP